MEGPLLTDKPQPSASGTFERTPLSHVLTFVHDRNLSGSIEIESVGRTDLIFFRQGFPARVRLAEAAEPLGRVLLEMGLIDDDAFTRSLMALGGGKGLQGRILIEQGALDLPGLVKGLREQLRRKLVKLFAIPDATYAYYDGVNLLQAYGGEETIRVDPYPILLAGVRFAYQEDRLQSILRRLSGQALEMGPDSKAVDRFELRDDERTLVAFFQEAPRTLETILGAGLLPEHDAKALCYCLVLTQQVDVVPASKAVAQAPKAPPPSEQTAARAVHPPPVPSPPPPAKEARPPPVPSPPPPAKEARLPSVPPPPPPAAGQVAVPSAPAVRPQSAPRLSASGRPSRPAIPAAPADASAEVLATREEIVRCAEAIDTQDYFVMLGVTHEDSEEALRSRYFDLAKKFHPDRVPPGLEDLRETLDYVFANLTEAYVTLTEFEKRRRYLELLHDGSGTPADQRKIQTIVDSAMNLQKAEVCLRRRNYDEAEDFCRKAMEGNTEDGEATGLLAWILMHRRPSGAALDDVLDLLRKAIGLSPSSEKVNFYMGSALKRTGKAAAAVSFFRKAADINPKNFDALREVRLAEMRRERGESLTPGEKKQSGGLLGRLFGKK